MSCGNECMSLHTKFNNGYVWYGALHDVSQNFDFIFVTIQEEGPSQVETLWAAGKDRVLLTHVHIRTKKMYLARSSNIHQWIHDS